MNPLAAVLVLAVPVSAGNNIEVKATGVAASATGASAASVVSVPNIMAHPSLGGIASMNLAGVSRIDPLSLPRSGVHMSPAEWGAMVKVAPAGRAEILRSMGPSNDPQVAVTVVDGDHEATIAGGFKGLNGDQIVIQTSEGLVGIDPKAKISRVIRTADINWDQAGTRNEFADVEIFHRPTIKNPFRDLASALKSKDGPPVEVEIDYHDVGSDGLPVKHSMTDMTGTLESSDGKAIVLKGGGELRAEDRGIDRIRVRRRHFDSKGKVSSADEINRHIAEGTPVEAAMGMKVVSGLFRGVRSGPNGTYLLLEVPDEHGSTMMRPYRDFGWVRTQGFKKEGELMPDAVQVYESPDSLYSKTPAKWSKDS